MIRLIALGDIFLRTKSEDDPFIHTKRIFKEKNILFGNLEVVLSLRGKKAEKSVILDADPKMVQYLVDSDFDVLNVANNHVFDRDLEGLTDTIDNLKSNGLNYVGTNEEISQSNLILDRDGIKIGFLGYENSDNPYLNQINEKDIISDINSLKSNCDIVVISLHWGIENVYYPSPDQIKIAHKLIDNGANLILGHHSHVIQGIEEYKNGLIAYSLGNFNFDTILSQSKTNKSIILAVDMNKNEVVGYDLVPIEIDENYTPIPINDGRKDEVIRFMSRITEPIINNKITDKWWFEEISEEYLLSNTHSSICCIKRYGVKHFISFLLWLISPFNLKCYAGLLRKNLKKI